MYHHARHFLIFLCLFLRQGLSKLPRQALNYLFSCLVSQWLGSRLSHQTQFTLSLKCLCYVGSVLMLLAM